MSRTRLSRREFVLSSLATGIAGIVSRHAKPAAAASSSHSPDQWLTFEMSGDREHGYGVEILFQRQKVARHKGGGEFSAVFQSADRSLEDRVENWRASSWTGNPSHVYLQGKCKLPNLNTTVSIKVEYEAVAAKARRKRIRFQQADSYILLYEVTKRPSAVSRGVDRPWELSYQIIDHIPAQRVVVWKTTERRSPKNQFGSWLQNRQPYRPTYFA